MTFRGDILAFGWPEARWNWISEGDYNTLEWFGPGRKPTEEEIEALRTEYERHRAGQIIDEETQRRIDAIMPPSMLARHVAGVEDVPETIRQQAAAIFSKADQRKREIAARPKGRAPA